jgi:glycosyltransferase involved in cell wall biosynthesis
MALRILHIIPTVNPASGGPIEGIRQLARCHHSYGHRLEIASLDPPGAPWLAFPGVPVYPLRSRWHERWLPLTLIRWLRSHHHQFDAVVINGIWNFHLCAAWLVLRGTSTPYLVFTHGMLDPWFRWRYPLKHLKKWLAWPWAMYPALRDADAVCFTCNQERLLARHSFWLYDANEQVVSYGTQGLPEAAADLAGPFLHAHPPLAGRHRLLFLGRVAPKKAPDLLLRAIARLQREGLWDPAAMVLVLAGPAEDLYAQRLQRLAAQLGITDSLHWTGMLQGDQKWGAFQAADAFVLASHQENFGIAVAEALSCATPVLLSHAVNIAPEIAADGAGLVDTDTPGGVTRLLRRWLLLPPAERTAMAANARRCFEQRYRIEAASRSLTRSIHLAKLQRQLQKLGG